MENNPTNNYDLIIVGGGPIGLATAYHYKKINKNATVLVLEKAYIHNQSGSSNGQTRQFRYQYAEDYMVALAYKSEPYWKELENFHGKQLINRSGSLWFGDDNISGSEGQITPAKENLDKFKLPYEVLSGKEIENRFGFKGLKEDEVGLFQKDGGTIDVIETITALRNLCIGLNVEILSYKEVSNIAGKIIKVDGSTYNSTKIVVTAGASSKELVGERLNTEVWNLASIHYKLKDETKDVPSWFYFSEQVRDGEGHLKEGGFYYGFEKIALQGKWYLRICPAFANKVDLALDSNVIVPLQEDIDMTTNWVHKHLDFVHPVPEFISLGQVSLPCAAEKKLYLDYIDHSKDVLVCSSGWNFKFIPLLGYINAMEVSGKEHGIDITPFKLDSVSELKLTTKSSGNSRRLLPF